MSATRFPYNSIGHITEYNPTEHNNLRLENRTLENRTRWKPRPKTRAGNPGLKPELTMELEKRAQNKGGSMRATRFVIRKLLSDLSLSDSTNQMY